MKKNVKKKALALATETVAILNGSQFEAIAGGATVLHTVSHASVCRPCPSDIC